MGFLSHLHDVSGTASLPLLLLASLASMLASVFSGSAGANASTSSATASILSSVFAAFAAHADHLAASSISTVETGGAIGDYTVCLSVMAEGDHVRTLACRHAFHAACLDGWFDMTCLSCLLCRAGLAARDDVGRRAREDAVSWFSRF